ncbi:hypothetical protein D3C76_1284910 [compost metagenome]
MQGFNLRAQIVRHRRAMGFVMFKQLIPESFAFRIEDYGGMARLILQDQATQHVQHAIHCARRLSRAVGQRRKRMIRPIEVRRTVDENKRIFGDLNHNVRAFE